MTYNIYCDESCHLEKSPDNTMLLGAVWCPTSELAEVKQRLAEIKATFGIGACQEVKWGRLSPAKQSLYLALLDYFMDNDDLHFRTVVIPDKRLLDHSRFGQTHDDWYFKMYFTLINHILRPDEAYKIYLDIKDTRSKDKVKKLQLVLQNANYDFNGDIVQQVQSIRSHESSLMQLTDILMGAVGYAHRGLTTSPAKVAFVTRFKERAGYSLLRSTLPREDKVNIFVWRPHQI